MKESANEKPYSIDEFTTSLVNALVDKKAKNIRILNLVGLVSYCERIIICTGNSSRHVRALSEFITVTSKRQSIQPLGVEGQGLDKWVLIDLNDVIVHIFDPEFRPSYDLDALWLDAPEISLATLGIEVDADSDSDDDSDEAFFKL